MAMAPNVSTSYAAGNSEPNRNCHADSPRMVAAPTVEITRPFACGRGRISCPAEGCSWDGARRKYNKKTRPRLRDSVVLECTGLFGRVL